jgi:hypothetical protein
MRYAYRHILQATTMNERPTAIYLRAVVAPGQCYSGKCFSNDKYYSQQIVWANFYVSYVKKTGVFR